MAPYCAALQAPGGRDLSICKRSDKNDDDPAKTAFVRRQSMDDNGHKTFHMLDADAGERWTNKLWGKPGSLPSKRAVIARASTKEAQKEGHEETEEKEEEHKDWKA
jgi:hypothetical protein